MPVINNFPTDGEYVDLESAQVIGGQKDFEITPRVPIGPALREDLPNSFTQLQYIYTDTDNTGPYIDTGYTINTATDTVDLVFELTSTSLYKWIFGEHDANINAKFGLGVGDGSGKRNVAYGATTAKVEDSQMYNKFHHFKADSNGVFIDGVKIPDLNYVNFTSNSTLALFCLHINGSFNSNAKGKIQSYKHIRNGVALLDLVPVKRNNDDKIGFYDFANNTFITSNNNSNFLAGPAVTYEPLLTIKDKSIYWCTYGVTTAEEILNALDEGKIPCVLYNDLLYVYYRKVTNISILFTTTYNTTNFYITVSGGGWSATSVSLESSTRKVTSLSSSSTNTQYPSAKCVYDALPKYYTQDGWTYRKWPNNFVELWKTSSEYTVSQNTFSDHPWGTLYHSADYVNGAWSGVVTDSYTYPITFAEDPNISVTLCATGDGNGWLATAQTGTNPDIKQATPRYFFVRPTAYGVKFKVCFYITGFEAIS